jgi:argininosuccinate synthase
MAKSINKIVLAYSGGLDTSAMLLWLKETYNCEVVCYTADVGQGEELTGLDEKARATGASKLYVEDLREEFRQGERALRRCVSSRDVTRPAGDRETSDRDRAT